MFADLIADYNQKLDLQVINGSGAAGQMKGVLNVAGINGVTYTDATPTLPEPEALGAEFVRWEIATAVAGAILGINPFDEPNVQQAKDATRALLEQYKATGALPMPPPGRTLDTGVSLTLTQAAELAWTHALHAGTRS